MTETGPLRSSGYLPISDYGLIGDCRSAALVGTDGSIDWLCLPNFDDPAVFGRILDARKGGCWQIEPTAPYRAYPRYKDLSNLYTLRFSTRSGAVLVTDFMPMYEEHLEKRDPPPDLPRVIRLVECLSGRMTLRHVFTPRPGFGTERPEIKTTKRHLHADSDSINLCMYTSSEMHGPRGTFTVEAGDTVAFALRGGHDLGRCAPEQWTAERAREALRTTQAYWWRWIAACRYDGPYAPHVWRSALALKLMTFAPTGAIVAAPTTSLPEVIGGARNWDYRFTWLRDASLVLFAFFQLGFREEAHNFYQWLSRRHLGATSRDIPNLFDLGGRARIVERELPHLHGYLGSRPVRVGNAAVNQLQLDVYGELLDSAYLYARFGGEISRALWKELHDVVEHAIDRWQEPDQSIWEVRNDAQHFTYSKLMCWVAVDRGIRIADRYELPYDAGRWRSARAAIHRRVVRDGYSKRLGAFTQVLGGEELDAAVLRISQIRFLPDRDPRVRSTVEAIAGRLGRGALVRRYDEEASPDGLGGAAEGAFLMCSFWIADAYAHLGDVETAQRWFEQLTSLTSRTFLYSEEVGFRDAELLGNFPQGFTHLSLIGAAVNIERARHRHIGGRAFS